MKKIAIKEHCSLRNVVLFVAVAVLLQLSALMVAVQYSLQQDAQLHNKLVQLRAEVQQLRAAKADEN
ncbi:MAG: hypothetical protein Q4B06_00210 [Candidatus Saccharibacteria bacterium]|nr:hypothetical protein [Candidatus Saccharibacteria bacterium]